MNLRAQPFAAIASAKAGFSAATGYRFETDPASQRRRRRVENDGEPIPSPMFGTDEVVPMLKAAPGLRPIAVSKNCAAAIQTSAPERGGPSSAASGLGGR